MRRASLRSMLVLVALLPAAVFELAGQPAGVPSTKNGDWTHYTGDVRGTRYAPLDQINASNFNQLEVAWHGRRPAAHCRGRERRHLFG